jgi:4-hydroxy-3-methylbut-2-enyl diphosphate reductase
LLTIKRADDVLTIGQVVDVKVLDVNVEKQKISLSIKEVKPIDKEDDADDIRETAKKEVKDEEIEPTEHIENASNTIGEMFGKSFGKDK